MAGQFFFTLMLTLKVFIRVEAIFKAMPISSLFWEVLSFCIRLLCGPLVITEVILLKSISDTT